MPVFLFPTLQKVEKSLYHYKLNSSQNGCLLADVSVQSIFLTIEVFVRDAF